ncbi:histidine phosphatase family protein [Marinactinospora thermotolerans]|uniref:Broad specificity phosphatase PhoE n=1 Tax=Marinactinospora thermotolerans DSM 45154 TaxID=1122192 RepID=A0A1T4N286_9ACTN|nr:histidine phosphatase family protein [Marinactinospora thermotolerans]SJZ73125.1 Broad specificity phosphatase PhoE [Marinactinospora thermotolerans DSM 45154]
MSTTTVVHLLRHGEVHNPAGVLYGRLPDFHLSERGRRMAELAAKWFAGRDLKVLYSSPLERAQETAEPLADGFGLPIQLDDRLIEAGNSFQGKPFTSRAMADPRTWRRLYNPFLPSWGESYTTIVARMVEVIKQVRREAWGGEAVCVSHQLPIWMARRASEGQRLWHRPDRRQCNLASVTSLTFEDYRLVSVGYSEPAAELYTGRASVPGA